MRTAHKWIIRGIVLFHVALALALAAFFLHRRHQRKVNTQPFRMSTRSVNNQQQYQRQHLHYARVGSWPEEGHTATQPRERTGEGASGGTSGGGQGGGLPCLGAGNKGKMTGNIWLYNLLTSTYCMLNNDLNLVGKLKIQSLSEAHFRVGGSLLS